VESAQLVHGDGDVAITSMAFGRAEAGERMVVGSESGLILSLPSKTQDSEQMTPLHGHFGMVTSVDVNPSASAMLRGLVLSSSVDWTTKLWHMDKSSRPIMSFSHGSFDYVCDARWSPSHPALFIAANISGEMSLWDLHHSTEEPRVPPIQVNI
jgi:dynein intermediate chain